MYKIAIYISREHTHTKKYVLELLSVGERKGNGLWEQGNK